MVKVIDDDFRVCTDCLMVIANGDYTGLDYYTTPDDPDYADRRAKEIDDGIERQAPGHICAGDSDKDRDFSHMPCECCGSQLSGARHHCVILGEE